MKREFDIDLNAKGGEFDDDTPFKLAQWLCFSNQARNSYAWARSHLMAGELSDAAACQTQAAIYSKQARQVYGICL